MCLVHGRVHGLDGAGVSGGLGANIMSVVIVLKRVLATCDSENRKRGSSNLTHKVSRPYDHVRLVGPAGAMRPNDILFKLSLIHIRTAATVDSTLLHWHSACRNVCVQTHTVT